MTRILPLTKRLLILTMFLQGTVPLFAQDILWEKSYGGKQADYLFDVVPTPDYGFILAGSSLSKKSGSKTENNRGDMDYWVWKMDEKGNQDWQKTFGGKGQDKLNCVLLTNDGGYLLAGTSDSSEGLDKKAKGRGETDFWLIKLNAKGGEEWQKTIGGSGQDELNSIVRTRDGGFVLAGSSSSEVSSEKKQANFGSMDYWVVKIDKEGSIVWQNSFGGIYTDELRSVISTQDGGYLLGGSSNSPEGGNKTEKTLGGNDYWIIKLDDKGQVQWQKVLGGTGDDQLSVVHQTAEGNYILGGSSNSDSGESKTKGTESGSDFWLVCLDKEQKVVWQETYNLAKVDVLTSLVENDDHTLLLGGYAQGEIVKKKGLGKRQKALAKKQLGNEEPPVKAGTDDYIAIKINAKGEEQWRKSVGSKGQDILNKVIETRDGGYLMAGTSKGKISNDRNSGIGSNDFWVVKLLDKNKPKPDKKPVEAIPNPATDYTNVIVGYDFTKGTATLVDIAGHVLQQFEITERTVPIDLQGYPEGIYIVNIKTDVQNSGVKIIKARK
jgi:hypothetical protein